MKVMSLLCLVSFSLLFPFEGLAGNAVLNGGDSVSIDFTAIAKIVIRDMDKQEFSGLNREVMNEIKAQLNQIKVYSADKTFLTDGQEVDAINEPQAKKITVSRSRWWIMRSQMRQRLQLVLHEYIGVIGYNDENYVISQPLVESLKPETILKVTSQKDYLEHLDQLIQIFYSYYIGGVAKQAQICMDAGAAKSEWRVIRQVYDGKAWYSDVAGADYSMEVIAGLVENLQDACLKSNATSQSLQEWGEDGMLYAPHLYFNIMR